MSKGKFITNGVLINRLNGTTINIITTKRMVELVEALAFISSLENAYKKADDKIKSGVKFSYGGYELKAWYNDIELAVSRLQARTTTTTTTTGVKQI